MRILLAIGALSAFLPSIMCNRKFPRPRIIPDPHVDLLVNSTGETTGLIYYNNQLVFTDTIANKICAHKDLRRQTTHCSSLGHGFHSFAIPVANHEDQFVVGFNNRISIVKWNTATNNPSITLMTFDEIHLPESEAINYAVADSLGGLWIFTMNVYGPSMGRLISFHPFAPSPQVIIHSLPEIPASNGIVWSIRYRNKIYCIDGVYHRIMSYNYDRDHRAILQFTGIVFDLYAWARTLPRPIFHGDVLLGRMTIDTKGRLWVPLQGGSHVIHIDPQLEKVLQVIEIPAVKVSACVFGSMAMNILYVSTKTCAPVDHCPPTDKGGKIFAVSHLHKDVLGDDGLPFRTTVRFINA